MSNPQKSLELFNQAVAMKRAGRFAESIRLQKQSILEYPEDPELPNNYYSMGKTYYLMGEYDLSIACYKVYNGLCVMMSPAILADYRKALSRDSAALQRLSMSFRNLAHNLGHSLNDPKMLSSKRNEIRWYTLELMGRRPAEVEPNLARYEESYWKYDDECADIGFNVLEYLWQIFLKNQSAAENEINDLAMTLIKI